MCVLINDKLIRPYILDRILNTTAVFTGCSTTAYLGNTPYKLGHL